jgi:ParB/RepB/Spo0J family partition protein
MQAELKYVPLDALRASADNVRRHHDDAKHAELVASIQEHGILTPLVVRPSLREGEYEVAAGHRRLRAATELGLAEVAVSVRSMGDRTFREVMLTENLQRVDPDPLDEADAYQSMIDELGYDVATLAAKFGKGETYVRARLVLTRLAPSVRTALEAGRIELGHAVLLARVSEEAQAVLLTEQVLASRNMPSRAFQSSEDPDSDRDALLEEDYDPAGQEGAKRVISDPVKTTLSIGELRALMSETLLPLNCVKWDRSDASLVVTAGSCSACPKRTGANPTLFEELNADDDRCSDASCYETKTLAWLSQRADAVRAQAPAVVLITTKRQRKLKALDRAPVLRVEHGWKAAKPGTRGSVPALVVESGAYSTADRWAELGELRDVKQVKPDAAKKVAEKAASTRGASGSSGELSPAEREAWAIAERRFLDGIGAVIDAIALSAIEPEDHRDAVVRRVLEDDRWTTQYQVRQLVKVMLAIDTPPGPDATDDDDDDVEALDEDVAEVVAARPAIVIDPRRSTLVAAGVLHANLRLPSLYVWGSEVRASIVPETGTFDIPGSLVDFAASAGVRASEVWYATLAPATAGVA